MTTATSTTTRMMMMDPNGIPFAARCAAASFFSLTHSVSSKTKEEDQGQSSQTSYSSSHLIARLSCSLRESQIDFLLRDGPPIFHPLLA